MHTRFARQRGGKPALASTGPVPTIVSATIDATGDLLIVALSVEVEAVLLGNGGFALTGLNGGATTLTLSLVDGDGLGFDISRVVSAVETGGVLAYTPGSVVSRHGQALARRSGVSVTNSSEQ